MGSGRLGAHEQRGAAFVMPRAPALLPTAPAGTVCCPATLLCNAALTWAARSFPMLRLRALSVSSPAVPLCPAVPLTPYFLIIELAVAVVLTVLIACCAIGPCRTPCAAIPCAATR
jgi:hypothetical protein